MHTIVYLDQCYLSNMAKAQCRLVRQKEEDEFWRRATEEMRKEQAEAIARPGKSKPG